MIEVKDVHGSEAASAPLIVGLSTVYVHTNIRKIPMVNPMTQEEIPDQFEWVYDEKQYDKDEYIKLMSEQGTSNEEAATANRADIDYLMLMSDLS